MAMKVSSFIEQVRNIIPPLEKRYVEGTLGIWVAVHCSIVGVEMAPWGEFLIHKNHTSCL